MRYSVVLSIGLLMSVGTALPAAIAYVGNFDSISVVDIGTNTQVGSVSGATFVELDTIAITPNATKAYVSDNSANTVSVVNASTDAFVGLVSDPMGYLTDPRALAITPDGTKAYVVNLGGGSSVAVVNTLLDTATGLVDNPVIAFSVPSQIAIAPDGSKAYVTNKATPGYVSIINVASNLVTGTVIDNGGTFNNCVGIAISSDGTKGYVANRDGGGGGAGSVSIFNVNTGTVTGAISSPSFFDQPNLIAISPNGLKGYVANRGSGRITVLDLTGTPSATMNITLPSGAAESYSMAFSPDGTQLYVVNYQSGGRCYVIDVATDTVSTVTGTFSFPFSVATYNRNNAVPVANSSSVSTLQTQPVTFTLTGTDADNNPLTFSIVTPPAHGVLTLVSTSSFSVQKRYAPNGLYQGADSFTFKVNDGYADSAPGLVSITVNKYYVDPENIEETQLAQAVFEKYYPVVV